ncbi:hypothetical protein IAR50_006162 [Cryptococcus sp. DSM 104548]
MSILRLRSALSPLSNARRYATASAVQVTSSTSNASASILGNIEATWKNLPADEQYEIYQQLEQIQKKDWKELTIDEKKAAYFVSFGPHGPRAPVNGPNHSVKVATGLALALGSAVALFSFVRSQAPPPPATMNAEYQQQMTEYMKSQNMNPISGISSEGYKGKGMVQSP